MLQSLPGLQQQQQGAGTGPSPQHQQGGQQSFGGGGSFQQSGSAGQQQQQNGNNNNGNAAAPPAANGGGSQDAASSSQPEYTLAGILHYLQSEWRRYEKDRNEWEIERAEMRARIALLEGERRGVENLKADLMRRVKMLEYALRQERSKYLTAGAGAGAGASPIKNPAVAGLEKEAAAGGAATTLSGRSSPAMHESGERRRRRRRLKQPDCNHQLTF